MILKARLSRLQPLHSVSRLEKAVARIVKMMPTHPPTLVYLAFAPKRPLLEIRTTPIDVDVEYMRLATL
jgi:hypothetical protein